MNKANVQLSAVVFLFLIGTGLTAAPARAQTSEEDRGSGLLNDRAASEPLRASEDGAHKALLGQEDDGNASETGEPARHKRSDRSPSKEKQKKTKPRSEPTTGHEESAEPKASAGTH